VSAASAILLVVLLVGLWATGAAVLLRIGRGDEDEAGVLDGAVALGLPVGLVLFALPGWLLTTFGRIPFVAILVLGGVVAVAMLVFCGNGLGWLRSPRTRGSSLVPSLVPVLVPVLVLLGIFAAYLWLRLGWADIRGTEKPMDLAVLSNLLVTPRLPLEDPWFAGERFPYYHFGTYVLALPFRLASVPPEYAYNLIVALVAGLAGAAAFGIVRLRGGGRVPAVTAALLLAFGGTFDGARQLLAGTSLGSLDLWPSSRRVADTITEWPLFTLWLGDLHPHAVALPFLLSFAAVAGRFANGAGLLLDAALLAALFSANPWDLPGALLLLGAGTLAARELKPAFLRSVSTLAVSLPFLLPALLAPRPEFQGLRGVTGRTTSPEAFLHLGALLLVPALAIGIALLRSRDDSEESFLLANVFPALGIFLAVVTKRPVLGLGAAFLLALLRLLPRLKGALRAGFLLAGAGVALLLVPELVVVRDPYGEQLHRMNTVFKCYAAAAALLAPAAALLLPLALSTRRARWVVRGALVVAVAGLLAHPASLVLQRWTPSQRTLDGLTWMTREAPGDRKAVEWIRQHAPPDARIVEAVGGAYTDHGRIGGATGRPIVLGWPNHQGLWRGGAATAEIDARKRDVETIYRSAEPMAVREALARRAARYVVVGPLERKEYGPDLFRERAGTRRVFSGEGTELWEVLP
jgi:YYY domain-containing protein